MENGNIGLLNLSIEQAINLLNSIRFKITGNNNHSLVDNQRDWNLTVIVRKISENGFSEQSFETKNSIKIPEEFQHYIVIGIIGYEVKQYYNMSSKLMTFLCK